LEATVDAAPLLLAFSLIEKERKNKKIDVKRSFIQCVWKIGDGMA